MADRSLQDDGRRVARVCRVLLAVEAAQVQLTPVQPQRRLPPVRQPAHQAQRGVVRLQPCQNAQLLQENTQGARVVLHQPLTAAILACVG